MSVYDLKAGQSAKIICVPVFGAVGERLSSLGIKSGCKITLLAFSVFRGGVLVSAGYNRVALRKAVAEKITVECI